MFLDNPSLESVLQYMTYLTYVPANPLAHFIEWLFFYEDYAPEHTREKRLPDGAVEMVINLTESPKLLFENEGSNKGQTFNRNWISGQQKKAIIIDVAGKSTMMGVRFKLGGASPFFPFPMSELQDAVVELDTIWGNEAHFLQEKLAVEPAHFQKFKILEQFLLSIACRELAANPYIEYAAKILQTASEDYSIQKLVQKTGFSHKHFIRIFDQQIGIKPKMLSRIYKFQKAIQLLENRQSIKWTDLSYECGYYDQAHFIKEFQAFSGINPSSYFDQRGEFMNYLPV